MKGFDEIRLVPINRSSSAPAEDTVLCREVISGWASSINRLSKIKPEMINAIPIQKSPKDPCERLCRTLP